MIHEKTFVRDDKSAVRIRVHFSIIGVLHDPYWRIVIYIKPAKKRKFVLLEFDDWKYRSLSMEDRRGYEVQEFLKYLSAEEILEAKTELWNKLKPV